MEEIIKIRIFLETTPRRKKLNKDKKLWKKLRRS